MDFISFIYFYLFLLSFQFFLFFKIKFSSYSKNKKETSFRNYSPTQRCENSCYLHSHNQGRSQDFSKRYEQFSKSLCHQPHLPPHNNVFTLYSVFIYLLISDSSLFIVYCYIFFNPPTFSGTHMRTVRTGSYATDNCLQQQCLISKTCTCNSDPWTARSLPFHLLSCFSLFLDLFGQLESNTVADMKHGIFLLNATNVEQR